MPRTLHQWMAFPPKCTYYTLISLQMSTKEPTRNHCISDPCIRHRAWQLHKCGHHLRRPSACKNEYSRNRVQPCLAMFGCPCSWASQFTFNIASALWMRGAKLVRLAGAAFSAPSLGPTRLSWRCCRAHSQCQKFQVSKVQHLLLVHLNARHCPPTPILVCPAMNKALLFSTLRSVCQGTESTDSTIPASLVCIPTFKSSADMLQCMYILPCSTNP